jgi:uncharacterized protein (DUF1330 family)
MEIRQKMTLTLVAGMALGGAAVEGLQAQAKPPVYVVEEKSEIADPAGLKAYAAKEDVLIQKNGGKFFIQGGKPIALDGTPPVRFTMIVFDSMEKMQAWQDEPSQKELQAMRAKASKGTSFAIEGKAN